MSGTEAIQAALARLSADLEATRKELETTREELARLRTEVAAVRGPPQIGMRSRLRCPDCGCSKVLHSRKVLDRAEGETRRPLALIQPCIWSFKELGEFEAYVCTKCGLTEWFVKGASKLAQVHPELFNVIEGAQTEDVGPYR